MTIYDRTHFKSVARGQALIETYISEVRGIETPHLALREILCDMFHWAYAHGLETTEEIDAVRAWFAEEILEHVTRKAVAHE